MSTPEIANLLRAIAAVIERNDSADILRLTSMIQGEPQQVRRSRPTSKGKLESQTKISDLASKISAAGDRTQARYIIEREDLTKKDLLLLSSANNVHVTKEDKIETIESKIVEALVGSRLNSKAIRGQEKI